MLLTEFKGNISKHEVNNTFGIKGDKFHPFTNNVYSIIKSSVICLF